MLRRPTPCPQASGVRFLTWSPNLGVLGLEPSVRPAQVVSQAERQQVTDRRRCRSYCGDDDLADQSAGRGGAGERVRAAVRSNCTSIVTGLVRRGTGMMSRARSRVVEKSASPMSRCGCTHRSPRIPAWSTTLYQRWFAPGGDHEVCATDGGEVPDSRVAEHHRRVPGQHHHPHPCCAGSGDDRRARNSMKGGSGGFRLEDLDG